MRGSLETEWPCAYACPHACLLLGVSLPSPTQDTSSKCPKPSYSTVCYTQKGLAYYSDWGTLRNTGE